MGLFMFNRGLVVSCDVEDLGLLESLTRATGDLTFVQGYKIGSLTVVSHGVFRVMEVIRRNTGLPVIYDHQKYGTDIPDICGGRLIGILKEAGVDSLVIFPQAGIETLKASVKGCLEAGLVPLVGGEMTHRGFLRREGGYLGDDSPGKIYADAASLGVTHFIVPGNRVESIKSYRVELERLVDEPVFLFPGVGSGQGGDISEAFKAIYPHAGYAIVGRAVYGAKDFKDAALSLWRVVDPNF